MYECPWCQGTRDIVLDAVVGPPDFNLPKAYCCGVLCRGLVLYTLVLIDTFVQSILLVLSSLIGMYRGGIGAPTQRDRVQSSVENVIGF